MRKRRRGKREGKAGRNFRGVCGGGGGLSSTLSSGFRSRPNTVLYALREREIVNGSLLKVQWNGKTTLGRPLVFALCLLVS